MRDAYILDIAATRAAPQTSAERLQAAGRALAELHARSFTGESPVSWIGVSSTDGGMARGIGLLAGYSAQICAQDLGVGSGLGAIAGAARAVTSGFESVAAAVAVGPPADEPGWPEALRERFTPVSVEKAQRFSLVRADIDPEDVCDRVDARRAAWAERGEVPVELGALGDLPLAPDRPGIGVALMAGHTEIREHQWKTRARITSVVQTGLDPALGPAAAARAAEAALHRLHLRSDEIDFVQVDARSAATPAVVAKALGMRPDQINPMGGALCVGGAGGASGFADLQQLLDALEAADRRFGMVVGLEPMGGATAVVVDRQFYM